MHTEDYTRISVVVALYYHKLSQVDGAARVLATLAGSGIHHVPALKLKKEAGSHVY